MIANDRLPAARIAAVVVTFNRLTQLQECLAALQSQRRPLDEIVIVNNGSSDGTADWLAAQPGLTVITQPNMGGAGGFYTGLHSAYQRGHDWVWCMDDDGYPAADSLEKLLVHAAYGHWLNCLVLDRSHPERLAFHAPIGDHFSIQTADFLGTPLQEGWAHPFNGTLLKRSLVDAVGFPAADLFIWGDEAEYLSRVKRLGFRVLTATDALFYHPASASTPLSQVPYRSFWKYYYRVRNHQATADRDGVITLNARAATQLGYELCSELLKDAISIPLKNLAKMAVIIHAVWAARKNNLARKYKP